MEGVLSLSHDCIYCSTLKIALNVFWRFLKIYFSLVAVRPQQHSVVLQPVNLVNNLILFLLFKQPIKFHSHDSVSCDLKWSWYVHSHRAMMIQWNWIMLLYISIRRIPKEWQEREKNLKTVFILNCHLLPRLYSLLQNYWNSKADCVCCRLKAFGF